MAHQEDGWPLGLRPLNARVGLGRNRDTHGSISFSTLITESLSSSTDSSSDLDTESTGSFFHDKSITLGNLIGVTSILELSRRSSRERTADQAIKDQKNYKLKPWLFSLCSRLTTDAVNRNSTPSLGHFLAAERRVQRSMNPETYETDSGFFPVLQNSNLNPLFVVAGGGVGPETNAAVIRGGGGRSNSAPLLGHGNGYGTPLLLSCLRGQLIE